MYMGNLLTSILAELSCRLYKQLPTLSYPLMAIQACRRPTLGYRGAALLWVMHSAQKSLWDILVQHFSLHYMHTDNYSQVCWYSSVEGHKYTEETILGYPGAAQLLTIHTHMSNTFGYPGAALRHPHQSPFLGLLLKP